MQPTRLSGRVTEAVKGPFRTVAVFDDLGHLIAVKRVSEGRPKRFSEIGLPESMERRAHARSEHGRLVLMITPYYPRFWSVGVSVSASIIGVARRHRTHDPNTIIGVIVTASPIHAHIGVVLA